VCFGFDIIHIMLSKKKKKDWIKHETESEQNKNTKVFDSIGIFTSLCIRWADGLGIFMQTSI
jgi:hypothetical protein